MASEFFARKLNLELALNPLFHGPHEELMEETPTVKEVKVITRRNSNSRPRSIQSTGAQSSLVTGSNINSFEFKHRNPKGVYDFLKVKMEREHARTKISRSRKSKNVDSLETGNGGKMEASMSSVIKETDLMSKDTEKNGAKNENTNDEQSGANDLTETGNRQSAIVPEILHYSDEMMEGPLEVYEPIFVRFPVWKPAKLDHS